MTTTETKTSLYTIASFDFDGKIYEICYKPFIKVYETFDGYEVDGDYWWMRANAVNVSWHYDSFNDFIEGIVLDVFGIDMDTAYKNWSPCSEEDFRYGADFKDCIYKALCF